MEGDSLGVPKREMAPIQIASVLLLLAISVLTLVGCLGEEEEKGGEKEEKGGGETTSVRGETTGTGEETTTAKLAARNVALTASRDTGVVGIPA